MQPLQRFRFAAIAIICIMAVSQVRFLRAGADAGTGPDWAQPVATSIKRTGSLSPVQNQPVFASNLECSVLSYHLVANNTMQSGCFTPTAYGMMDSDTGRVIFNGTDEALPLLAYAAHQILMPWPRAGNLLVLDVLDTGGAHLGMYKSPLAFVRNQRNALGQLTAKQLLGPAEVTLLDAQGRPLVVNPQTMAFSADGSWLVIETLAGYFVRLNLATLAAKPFAPSFYAQGIPGLTSSAVAVSDDGRFVAISNRLSTSLRVYDLQACMPTADSVYGCPVHDYWPYVSEHINGFQLARHLRFINEGLLGFEALANDDAGEGAYMLAPSATITSMTEYLGLGDSYTSGEGAFDYLSGTDTTDNHCHTSQNSYPLLLANDLYGLGGGHNIACSGAKLRDITGDATYKGQVGHGSTLEEFLNGRPDRLEAIKAGFMPGYVSQTWLAAQWQPRVVTVSIGGNDIGFGEIIKSCVMPHLSAKLDGNTCYSSYEDRLELKQLVDRTVPRWAAMYRQLQASTPWSTVYAIGYPDVIAATGDCAANVHLSQDEALFAEELIAYLNKAIREAAVQANVTYVDISQALVGHRLCEASAANVAVNGLTTGNDVGLGSLRVIGHESYHPNMLGQALIEQAILEKTHNLTSAPAPLQASADDAFVNVAPEGRPVNALIPVEDLISPFVSSGATAAISGRGLELGLAPNSRYDVRLDGAEGPIISSVSSDVTGDINGYITLPPDTPTGGHTVDLTGPGLEDKPVDIRQVLCVTAREDTSNAQGIPPNTGVGIHPSSGGTMLTVAASSPQAQLMSTIPLPVNGELAAVTSQKLTVTPSSNNLRLSERQSSELSHTTRGPQSESMPGQRLRLPPVSWRTWLLFAILIWALVIAWVWAERHSMQKLRLEAGSDH